LRTWRESLHDAWLTGASASLLSTAALGICGRIEQGTAVGPNNGPSQWLWGEQAAFERRATLQHTAAGYAIHHLMSTFWAALHERLFGGVAATGSVPQTLAAGALTSALACFVDYRLTPRRLRPGFEKQLSRTALFFVYAAFAAGLVLPQLVRRLRV
jgi:hypothetical protein